MKPELIFITEKDGLITLSKEDIIELVDKAYKVGHADASTEYGNRHEVDYYFDEKTGGWCKR